MSVLSSFAHKPFFAALCCWTVGCSGSQSRDLSKFAQVFTPTDVEVGNIVGLLSGDVGEAYRVMRVENGRSRHQGNILLTPDEGYGDVLPLVSGRS